MLRTNITDVQSAIDTSLAVVEIDRFIVTASLWVDEHLAGEGLSAALLAEIEKYLACHFITLRDPRLARARLEDVEEYYQRDQTVTEYLKAAAALDSTGTIRELFMAPAETRRAKALVGRGYAT